MSIESQLLQRIALTKEVEANFATDLTGSATYYDLPFREGTAQITFGEPMLRPLTVQQRIDAVPLSVLGPKECQVTLTCNLAPPGSSAAAGDGADSVAETGGALFQLLAIMFGGIDAVNTGTTFDTVTDASNFGITDGTDMTDGLALGWVGSERYELHEVGNGNVATIALKQAFSGTPSGSDVAYAATTFYPTQNPTDSVQMIVEGAETDDRWLLLGGQCTAAPVITVANGEIPTIQVTLTFANWISLSAASITAATYANHEPIQATGEFRINPGGTQSRVLYKAGTFAYTLNSPVYGPLRSPSGVNTIGCWRRLRPGQGTPFASVAVTIPYEDTTWQVARANRSLFGIQHQIGVAAGETWLLSMPRCQVADWSRADLEGFAGQTITFETLEDAYTVGTPANDLTQAAMRLHVG